MDYQGTSPGNSHQQSPSGQQQGPSGQFDFRHEPRTRPLPALPNLNTQYFENLHTAALAAMRSSTPSEHSSQGDYATPRDYLSPNVYETPHYTPTDFSLSGDQTPTGLPGGHVPTSSPAHYSYPPELATDQQISEGPYVAQPGPSTTPMQPIHHGGIQNVHPYGAQPPQQMSGGVHSAHPYGAQPGPSTTPMQPIHNGEIQNMHPYQTNVIQYAYSNGAQPGPSTAPMQPTHNGEIQNIYPYGAQPSAGSSTTPTQESQNAMSSGDHRRNVRSRSEHHEMPIPQGKIRLVDTLDADYSRATRFEQMNEKMRDERQKRRAAEAAAKQARQDLFELRAQQTDVTTRARMAASEANIRAEKAEMARRELERDTERMRVEYENSLATIGQRFANYGPPLPQEQDAPPVLKHRFTSQSAREARQVEKIARNVGGNFLNLKRVNKEIDSADDGENNRDSSESESDDEGVSRKGKGKEKQGSRKGKEKKGSRLLGSDQRALAGMVREIMREMNVARVTRSKTKRKVCRFTALDRAKKIQQAKMTKNDDLAYKELAREIFRRSTKRNQAEDFANYKPATDKQDEECEQPEGEKPLPGVSPFYFGKGYRSSMWNDILLRGLVGDLRRMRAERPDGYGLPEVSTEYLIALFMNSVTEGQQHWARMQPRVGESENKVQARVEEFDEKTKKAKNSRARKETKFRKRITTARRMTLLCRGKPNALEIWKWVTRLLELLGTLGMSSEDPEPYYVRMGDKNVRETTHAIKICAWRPQKVTDVLKFVDDAAASSSLKRSTAARSRLRDDKISKSPAPQGLPETLYDEEWMQEGLDMDPEFKDDLRVSDEAFEILEFAAEGLGLQMDDENDDEEME